MSKPLDVFELPLQGKYLIEAGAGTGKTYNITSLYLRVLAQKKLMPNQVLVLTFTNDATNELKHRLRSRIKEVLEVHQGVETDDEFVQKFAGSLNSDQAHHLQECLYAFDEAAVSTIHGFCQRLLSEYAIDFEVSPNFELLTDELTLLTEVTDAFWVDFFFDNSANTDFEQWYRNYFEELFKAPEDFIATYREILLNPDLDIDAYNLNFDHFENIYQQAGEALTQLKQALEADLDQLQTIIDTAPLSGTYYRSKDEMLSEFVELIHTTQEPGLIFNGFETKAETLEKRFEKFGNFMPEKGLRKGGSIPHLSLFDRVDQFYALNNQLLAISEMFIGFASVQIRQKFSKLKQKRNQIGYNDLLVKVRDTLSENARLSAEIKRRFPVAFIDEFQDTDHIQYAIFQQIYGSDDTALWVMIGDPKQAIYRFRGADINTYLFAKKQVAESQHRTLLHNYRSSKDLISGINSFFNYAENPFGLDDLSFENAQYPTKNSPDSVLLLDNKPVTPVSIVQFDQNGLSVGALKNQVMDSVCSEIVDLLNNQFSIDNRSLTTADIAILVDKHQHATELQQKLALRGVKSIIRSKASVFETKESDELYRLLRAVAEFTNQRYIRAAMLTNLLRFEAQQVYQIFDSEEDSNHLLQRFADLHDSWQKEGFSKFINRLMVEFDLEENLVKTDQPERSITNLYHIKDLLVKDYREHGRGINGILRYFQEKRTHPNSDNEAEIIRLESDGELIQIVTHHASKGLEYPVVFCPFLWDLKKDKPPFIVQSDGKSTKVVLKNDSEAFTSAMEVFEGEEASEQKRLAYVALTRARLKCFVYIPTTDRVKYATGQNVIGGLWKDNVEPQSEALSEIEYVSFEANTESILKGNETVSASLKTINSGRTDLWEYPRLVSYSSLVSDTHSSKADDDFKDLDEVTVSQKEDDELDDPIFALPKGKNTGNVVHSIFEEIEFDNAEKHLEVIIDKMASFNIDKQWKGALSELIRRGLNANLKDHIYLKHLTQANKLVEMEFYVPVSGLSRTKMLELLGKHPETDQQIIDGYLKGFIDLIFRVGDTYYVLDYKTNHLGNHFDDYSEAALSEEMRSANYDVQYHLYTLALVRFLKSRIPHFDYDRHFGGVFYLFVRGINPEVASSGVFYDKPDFTLIEKLNALISEVEA